MFHLANPKLRSRSGFTLIELLVVTTIMIVLTSIGLVSYTQVNQNARNSKRRADLETVRQALVLYRTDEGTYPTSGSTTPSAGQYNTMITTLSTYLNNSTIQDPQSPTSSYSYAATGGGAGFTLCADLEPDGADYCVNNP